MRAHRQHGASTPAITLSLVGLVILAVVGGIIYNSLNSGPAADSDRKPPASLQKYMIDESKLTAESASLESAALEVEAVSSVDVMMRSNITVGQQVIIDATSTTSNPAQLEDALVSIIEIAWNNQLYVPNSLYASMVGSDGTRLDSKDVGFKRAGIGPSELYDRFGPPAADPDWRPNGN